MAPDMVWAGAPMVLQVESVLGPLAASYAQYVKPTLEANGISDMHAGMAVSAW
jgi:hypothetical protein